jgi:FtsH-binding integral membrane protein
MASSTFDAFIGSRSFSLNSILKFSNIDVRVQKHLSRVYATLAFSAAVLALGCYSQISMGAKYGGLTKIGALGCLLGLSFTSKTPQNLNMRYGLLAGFSFCTGASLAPLVGLAVAVAPSALVTAFLGTCAIFLTFSLSALTTQRRAYMYLGGYLGSAIMALLALRFGSYLFGGRSMVYGLELYGGLMIFSAYILYDTQLIVERASAGDMDHVSHALDLLVDLVAIFVRILIILLKRSEEEKRREEERRKRK